MDIEYLDFELEIGSGNNVTFPLSIASSPAGTMRSELNFPLGEFELSNRLPSLQYALLRSDGSRRTVLTDGPVGYDINVVLQKENQPTHDRTPRTLPQSDGDRRP